LCDPQLGTDAVASTSTSLGIAYQIKNWKLTYEITCKFSKTRSWGLLKTPYILAHEQAHFDITELYARKLHQALQQYTLNRYTFKKDIGEIYQRIVDEKEAFQAAYDGETDHSRNRRVQVEWLDKIELLLIETEPYADYP
jgi:predicted secreted Zn-dependent protease